ncbi:MAG TPA: TonB-dependent receptor [Caulobacteraceae bacterium]|nr:TonB-dependent receptor [Caulobacteraceae bacterium]
MVAIKNPLLGGGIVAFLLTGAAMAQAPASPAGSGPASAEAQTGLSEVIVTAQKRPERLQDVPISVSALSSTALATQNVHSLQDLTARVPSFVSTTSAGYGGAPLSIRGIGGANGGGEFLSDEPVAVYIDGVYVARLSAATSDLVDLDGIEVLRGPQGSLYGRNATAGALVISTKRPTNDFTAEAEAGGDTLKDGRASLAVSGPIVKDKVLVRIAGAYSSLGGFGQNVLSGKPVNDGHDVTLRGALRLLPTERLTIDMIGEYFDQHFQPGLFRVANLTGGTADSPFILRPDFQSALNNSHYEASEQVFNHIHTDAFTVLGELREDAFTVNSITGYRTFNVDGLADSDNAAPSALTGYPALRSYNAAHLRNSQTSQELRISSPASQKSFTWTAGLYYIHEINAVDPFEIYNNAAYFKLGTDATFHAFQTADAASAYGDASYEVVKGLTVRVGGRYSWDEKTFNDTQRVVTLLGGFSPALGRAVTAGFAVTAPPTYFNKADFHNLSGRAVADYKVTKDILAYASFSQGFKSGGFNAFGLTPAFQPETIDAYETGLKTQFWDRRLRINGDVFFYNYNNLQVRLPVPTGGVNIQNAASAQVKGAELETAFTPLTGLNFGLNVSYLDTRFTQGALPEVPPSARFSFGANIPLQTVSIVGNTMSRAPKWQLGLTADYQRPLMDDATIAFGMSYRYQTKEYFLETNQDSPTFQTGAWGELGLHATWAKAGGRFSVTLFGENVLNNRHLTQVSPLSAFPEGTLNLPSRFGVRTSAKF